MNPYTKQIIFDNDFYKILSTDYSNDEIDFLKKTRTIEDFKIGLTVPGKLLPHTIAGGVVLEEVSYEMRENFRC